MKRLYSGITVLGSEQLLPSGGLGKPYCGRGVTSLSVSMTGGRVHSAVKNCHADAEPTIGEARSHLFGLSTGPN